MSAYSSGFMRCKVLIYRCIAPIDKYAYVRADFSLTVDKHTNFV